MTTAREAIAEAANTVTGVHCSPYFRQTTKPGEGMVRLDHTDRASNGFGYVSTWQVVIVLSQNIAQSEKWTDDNASQLVAALSKEMVVTRVTPQQIAVDGGTVPCLFIEGSRETEE